MNEVRADNGVSETKKREKASLSLPSPSPREPIEQMTSLTRPAVHL
jgi:hypothetical protein